MNQPSTIEGYKEFLRKLELCTDDAEKIHIARHLCRTDLFFLLWYGCARADMEHPWLIARCKEVQTEPNGYLDLWAREHYKSTIITFGKTLQDILASHGENPLPEWGGIEPVTGIFSHTRVIAKGFLRQHKWNFETNALLKALFPDIIWDNCPKESPKWSEDDGLILKRKSNPKEATIEAWGLVEGQPTSKHFNVLVYDDVVTRESVSTPEMMKKTTEAWELSVNLGGKDVRRRHIGTRYHFNDTYRAIMSRGSATPRIYKATEDGDVEGKPVFKTPEQLASLRRDMGPFTFACQMLQNPVADETQGFRRDWVRFHNGSDGIGMNTYILVDPANEKKKTSDYTAVWVIGLSSDSNYYVLDLIRDRLNLTERADLVFRLHKKWRSTAVGYEKYGMQADVTYIKERMQRENYHFTIKELGGSLAKADRIRKLIPIFETGRMFLPQSRFYTTYEKKVVELVDVFLTEEYDAFPVPVHDDMLDCLSRILDENLLVTWPRIYEDDRYKRPQRRQGSAWSA